MGMKLLSLLCPRLSLREPLSSRPRAPYTPLTQPLDSSPQGKHLHQDAFVSPFGTAIYLSPDATVAVTGSSSSKQTLTTPAPSPYAPQLTLTGSIYTADPFGNFFIACQILTPGGAITEFNTPISLAQDGIVAVLGSNTQLIHPTGATAAPGLISNSATFAADSAGDFIKAYQAQTPGGAITVSGTPISVAEGGSVAVVGTSTQLLIHGPMVTQEPVFTFDGSTYTADASSEFTIEGEILTRVVTSLYNGTTLFFDAGGANIVVGTSTQVLRNAALTGTEAAAATTVGGQTYTADASQGFVIGGQDADEGWSHHC